MTTHEPKTPLPDFPYSHAKVEDVFKDSCPECIKITIHGDEHFVHRTTAFALYEQLQQYFRNLSPAEKEIMIYYGSNLGAEILS